MTAIESFLRWEIEFILATKQCKPLQRVIKFSSSLLSYSKLVEQHLSTTTSQKRAVTRVFISKWD